ncbi:MAG: chorismate mutase [Parvibaculum sp.]
MKGETRMVKCNTMADVRREIDRIDRELVKLLAERQTYIEQAGAIKGERTRVRDEARIEEVVQKVLVEADREGLSRAIAEPLWRLLIERSIAHEYDVFDAKPRATGTGD